MPFYVDEQGTIQISALGGSRTTNIYRLCIPLMLLTTIFVTLRLYVRRFMTKTFGLEDWLIIPAYILFISICACAILLVNWQQNEDLSVFLPRMINMTIASSVLYIIDHIFIKLSLAAYFYRICPGRQRYVIVCTVSLFALYNFAFVFVSIFQCGIPTVSTLLTSSATGSCISWDRVVKPLLYVGVSLNAVCDWLFVLACFPMLAQVRRRSLGQFVGVCFLIFLATGASVLSLVRIAYLPAGATAVLLLKHNDDFAVLSFVEAGVSIITVSLATLHPLFQACIRRQKGSRYPPIISPRGSDNTRQTPPEKKCSEPNSEDLPSHGLPDLVRLGVLPTLFGTELETMHESQRRPTAENDYGWND